MTEQTVGMNELMNEITAVLKAADDKDYDAIYDYRASIISMYAQAMVEFHFKEHQLEWLNDILHATENNQITECRQLLEQATDIDDIFLGSQFASMMAGCFHHDELMTVAQAVGLQALLKTIEQQNSQKTIN